MMQCIVLIFLFFASICSAQHSLVFNFTIKQYDKINKISISQNDKILYDQKPEEEFFTAKIVIDTNEISLFYIEVKSEKNYSSKIYTDTCNFDVEIVDSLKTFIFANSPLSAAYVQNKKEIYRISDINSEVYTKYYLNDTSKKSRSFALKRSRELLDSINRITYNFAQKHKNTLIELDFIYTEISRKNYSATLLDSLYNNNLEHDLKNSFWGKECKRIINFQLNKDTILNKNLFLINSIVKDSIGNSFVIKNLLKKDSKTIIIFCSDYCKFCKSNLTEIYDSIVAKQVQNRYQIIRLDADGEFDTWSKKPHKSNSIIKNYYLENGNYNELYLLLGVTGTPTNFLFDNNTRQIISRGKWADNLIVK